MLTASKKRAQKLKKRAKTARKNMIFFCSSKLAGIGKN